MHHSIHFHLLQLRIWHILCIFSGEIKWLQPQTQARVQGGAMGAVGPPLPRQFFRFDMLNFWKSGPWPPLHHWPNGAWPPPRPNPGPAPETGTNSIQCIHTCIAAITLDLITLYTVFAIPLRKFFALGRFLLHFATSDERYERDWTNSVRNIFTAR